MHNIKITSGKFRGRSIESPNLVATHPMGSREKLALFNMLAEYLPGATILDAYAGSGALGIEALSRGSAHVTFVEKNPRATAAIRKNLANLNLLEFSNISKCDAKSFSPANEFDIIIADPPYDNFELDGVKNIAKLLKETGVMIISHPSDAPEISGLKIIKTHRYAAARITLYKNASS